MHKPVDVLLDDDDSFLDVAVAAPVLELRLWEYPLVCSRTRIKGPMITYRI
eukprot:SAG31_NODE_28557_length_408_cov_0.974110_1_plen_50_part_10